MSGTVPVKWVATVLCAQLLEEALFGAADGLQLGAGFGEHRVGDVDELLEVHALGDPVEAADDHGAARQRVGDRAVRRACGRDSRASARPSACRVAAPDRAQGPPA